MGQIFAKCWRLKDHVSEEIDRLSAYTAMYRKFTYAELSAATNNFNKNAILGEGGFGCVYRGILPDTEEIVAVKRVSTKSERGKKEFISEVSIASGLRHRNVVQLLGLCHQRGELLLVYEYMPNRSLDRYLFFSEDMPSVLYWCRRYNIACELASALLYLHEELNHCVLHRNVKPSNVLLDSNFSTKLGGFGLPRLMEHDSDADTTEIAGTVGYLAPEVLITGRVGPKSDVFSFGAVALQIASGRGVLHIHSDGGTMRLVEWVWDLYGEGRILDCADPRLNAEFHVEQMERLLMVGLWCSHPNPQTRPSIRQVLKLLQFESSLPRGLPTEMPGAWSPRLPADVSSSSSP